MLHVGPPCAPLPVCAGSLLADAAGWIDVHKHSLQHTKYSNVFAIGDCNNCPTGKTAAKVAAEAGVLYRNIKLLMSGQSLDAQYDGYTSCPLTVGDDRLILAEFGYDLEIMETFPLVNQAKVCNVLCRRNVFFSTSRVFCLKNQYVFVFCILLADSGAQKIFVNRGPTDGRTEHPRGHPNGCV